MYSKELERLDRNTALGMLDDAHAELEMTKEVLDQTKGELDQTKGELNQAKEALMQERKESILKDELIEELKAKLAKAEMENT